MIPQYCKIFTLLVHVNECVRVHNKRNFPQAKLDNETNARFLLNELGNPYFLLHNTSVHILSSIISKKKLNLSEGEQKGERVHKTVTL